MTTRSLVLAMFGFALCAAGAADVSAQSLGQYRWQQQPYCNVVTVNVVQSRGVYELDGFDDQCGGGNPRAAVVGTAFLNPDGLIGMGLTIVTAPVGTPVQISVTLNPVSINGTWRDTSGNTGSFVFTPGAAIPGSPRPAPRAVFPAGLSAGGTTIVNVGSPVAASDAANRGYVDTVASTKADTTEVSLVVPLANPGVNEAFVFPAPQLTLGATTFTTPRSAHLLISMNVNGNIDCVGTDLVYWWIDLDGTPVRSSTRTLGGGSGFSAVGMPPINLDGITALPVAAGPHSVSVRGACTSGGVSGTTQNFSHTGYVTLLDAGYAARTTAPLSTELDPAASTAAPNCSVTITADGIERRVCP